MTNEPLNNEQREARTRKLIANLARDTDWVGREVQRRLADKRAGRLPKVRQQMLCLGSDLVQASAEPTLAGGECSNTPPAISQGEPVAKALGPNGEFAGGEDTAEISLWVEWGRFDILRSALEAGKQQAKVEAMGQDTERGDCVVVFDDEFVIMPTGTASDGKGPRYAWRLLRDGIKYHIADREEPSSSFPSVKVVIGSLPLMLRAFGELWQCVQRDIENLGGKIVRNTLSRVDVCVDLPDVPVTDFCAKKAAEQFICRASKGEDFEVRSFNMARRQTGFTIGAPGAALFLRVYDKLHEVSQKHDEAKLEALRLYRWGGALPDSATRVEWQCRREKLVAMEIDTVEDWLEKRAGVVRYFATQWIRFTEHDVDRANAHHTRAETWSVWERVVRSADFFLQACPLKAAKCVKRVVFDFQALARQTLGTVSSSIVYAQGVILEKRAFFKQACRELRRTLDAKDWTAFVKRQCRKRSLFEASNPASRMGEAPAHESPVLSRFETFMRGGAACGIS
ncbi:MAG: hypothetical protein C0483_03410 [Pirellula sp.]|nr:hypothetical protein [Pirellula sp.]